MQTSEPKHIDWIVCPGTGSESVFIGATEAEIVSTLGQPQSVSKYKAHRYYLYPKLGLEVDFNPRSRKAKALVFHRSGVDGYRHSPAETKEGLSPGATKRQVLDILGLPDRTSATDAVQQCFWYQEGIQFNFDEKGIVEVMIIFDPQMSLEEQCL